MTRLLKMLPVKTPGIAVFVLIAPMIFDALKVLGAIIFNGINERRKLLLLQRERKLQLEEQRIVDLQQIRYRMNDIERRLDNGGMNLHELAECRRTLADVKNKLEVNRY